MRSNEALLEELSRGTKFTFLYFWGHTVGPTLGPTCLSQWYPAPFDHSGVHYETAEHFMMASKARCFGDDETLAQILTAKTPKEAKALGRKVRNFDSAKWDAARFDAVVTGSVAKFSSTPALRAYLLSTKDAVLVEASPLDRIWGIGLGRDQAERVGPSGWKGLNLLGYALMEARARLH